jgi:hypothetical protein
MFLLLKPRKPLSMKRMFKNRQCMTSEALLAKSTGFLKNAQYFRMIIIVLNKFANLHNVLVNMFWLE